SFQELLCAYLPRRYIVEPGFVVTETDAMSDYIDLLIVDVLHIPPLCNDPPVRIFAAESIVAAIEITAAPLVSGKLRGDVLKLAKVRGLSRVRKYRDWFPIATDHVSKIELRQLDIAITLPARTILITCG